MPSPSILLFTHPACALHIEDSGHPESPERLAGLLEGLETLVPSLQRRTAREATREELIAAHTPQTVDFVLSSVPQEGIFSYDVDTFLSPASGRAVLAASGACAQAAHAIMDGPEKVAFCAIRPPGHHATKDTPGGFCIFNNIAIGALAALERHDVQRVGILDIDVHHGNGTQDIFWDEPRVAFASLHQWPLFPGSGREDERGAHGNIMNAPLPAGTNGAAWLDVIEKRLLPHIESAEPDILFVSAGFDAHEDDPLANLRVRDEDYGQLGALLHDFVERVCSGRIVFALEGGYDPAALGRSGAALLKAFA